MCLPGAQSTLRSAACTSRTGELMKTDAEIKEDVIRELRWDPQVTEPDALGVAVKDGAGTLTGHPSSYAEKLAAAPAPERVYGVKAGANDLEANLPAPPP